MAQLNIGGRSVELEGNASAETLSGHPDHLLTCEDSGSCTFTRASKHVRISNYFRRPREALFREGDFGAGAGFAAINSYTDM
jgi:hypothetical protein